MPKISLHSQAIAVDVAISAFRSRTLPKLRQSELEMIKRDLAAAKITLLMLNESRRDIAPRFIAECEGER